jgi:hypothetical protein
MLDRQAYIDQNMQKKSPFDEGVMRAVKSAKQSLALDEDQSDRAFRNGLMGFSEALNQDQTPTGRGFMGKFAAAARGVPAGMRAYDESEMAAQHQNSLHADMARRFRAGEEAKAARMEQDAYNREMNDQKMALEHEKLGEIRDYHNQSLMAKMANGVGQTVDYEGKPYKKLDKVEQRKANNVKKAINTSQHELDKIDTELSNLKDITKNNTYAPMGGVSFIANPVKDFIGDVFDIKDYQDETAKRKLLYATLGKFRVNAERALKGQGVLGQGFYDRLSPFFPNEKDSLPTLEEKLKDLNREMALEAQAANISADQGIAYDISDLPETEEGTQPIPDQNGYVAIVNIKTGKTGKVHLEDLEEAKNRGWDLK